MFCNNCISKHLIKGLKINEPFKDFSVWVRNTMVTFNIEKINKILLTMDKSMSMALKSITIEWNKNKNKILIPKIQIIFVFTRHASPWNAIICYFYWKKYQNIKSNCIFGDTVSASILSWIIIKLVMKSFRHSSCTSLTKFKRIF